MLFARPEFLLLLPLALAQAALALRSPAPRRWAAASLRLACATAVVLALGRPRFARPLGGAVPPRVVVDLGPNSTDAARVTARQLAMRTGGTLIGFSNRCAVIEDASILGDPARLSELKERLDRPLWPDDRPAGGSALAAALQLAGSQLDALGGGTVELVSNGLTTRGDAEAEAYRLARNGIAIHATPVDVRTPEPTVALVRAVDAPAAARVGQSLPVVVTVESAVPQRAGVRVAVGDDVRMVSAELGAGINHVEVDVPAGRAGLAPIRATVGTDAEPAVAIGLPAQAATFVGSPGRVLLVRPPDASPGVAAAVRAILRDGAELREASPAELDGRSLEGLGVLVLADVPADTLAPAVRAAIERATADGMGLLVTGAARAFPPGGRGGSVLGSVLPVEPMPPSDRLSASTSLVLIIDTSASMQGEKLDLAKDVARLAISHLEPEDQVGLVEFFGGKRWAAPLQSAANAAVIDRALARLTAGGGTTLYPAVEEAEFALRNVGTQAKHVLVVSDGFVEDAPFAALAREMADDGVSVSTVGVKADPHDRNLMPALAVWGRGRYYTVPDRFAVPDITLKRPTFAPRLPLVRTPTSILAGDDALVRGVSPGAWGRVDGYARMAAKANADVLLRTETGDPVLARWRYGAGWGAALMTQLGSAFAADLQRRPAFAQLLAGVFRQMGSAGGGGLDLRPTVRPAGVELAVAASGAVESGSVRITVSDADGRVVRTVDAEPTAVGQWNVLLVGLPSGAYEAVARAGASVAGTCGFAIAPPPAVTGLSPDAGLLARLERFRPLAERRASAHPVRRWLDLTRPLALAAMALLVLHVGWRRWPRRSPSISNRVSL